MPAPKDPASGTMVMPTRSLLSCFDSRESMLLHWPNPTRITNKMAEKLDFLILRESLGAKFQYRESGKLNFIGCGEALELWMN